MFRSGIGGDCSVVGLSQDGAGVGRGGRYRTEDVRVRWLFSQGSCASIMLCTAVNGIGTPMSRRAMRKAARGRRRCFAEDEELDEGSNEKDDGELTQQEPLCKR